eukprot:6589389-Lingulodinium_polyedra.AAC.1
MSRLQNKRSPAGAPCPPPAQLSKPLPPSSQSSPLSPPPPTGRCRNSAHHRPRRNGLPHRRSHRVPSSAAATPWWQEPNRGRGAGGQPTSKQCSWRRTAKQRSSAGAACARRDAS